MLSKSDILEAKDIETEVVCVPEWGGDVIVKGLTLEEKDNWTDSILEDGKANVKGASAKLCVCCMCDEENNRLFSLDDVPKLQEKSAAAMDRVFQVAQRLSGIGQEDIEETVKNSGKTQSVDSD